MAKIFGIILIVTLVVLSPRVVVGEEVWKENSSSPKAPDDLIPDLPKIPEIANVSGTSTLKISITNERKNSEKCFRVITKNGLIWKDTIPAANSKRVGKSEKEFRVHAGIIWVCIAIDGIKEDFKRLIDLRSDVEIFLEIQDYPPQQTFFEIKYRGVMPLVNNDFFEDKNHEAWNQPPMTYKELEALSKPNTNLEIKYITTPVVIKTEEDLKGRGLSVSVDTIGIDLWPDYTRKMKRGCIHREAGLIHFVVGEIRLGKSIGRVLINKYIHTFEGDFIDLIEEKKRKKYIHYLRISNYPSELWVWPE